MTSLEIGGLSILALLALIGLRVPVAVALTVVGIAGVGFIRNWPVALNQLKTVPFEVVANWNFSAVPMFILMGAVAHNTGISSELFAAARQWFARSPGGLAIAANWACAGFAAASGSSIATAAAMGRLAIPEMLRQGYNPGLASGVVASAGTLGVMIPPSIMFVLYGIFAEQSISQLLIAGIFPGLLTAAVYTVMIYLRCRFDPSLAPPVTEAISWAERMRSLAGVWPLLLLVVSIIGGLYVGAFTPTEAGAAGAAIAVLIALARGRLTWEAIRVSLVDTLVSTSALFFVAVGAVLFARLVTMSGLAVWMGEITTAYAVDRTTLLFCMAIIYVILGMFLDSLGLLLITLPIFLPLMKTFGYDLIWFGVLVVKFIEVGMLTPPLGLNVYAIKTVVGDAIPIETIFRGVTWFLVAEIVVVLLLIVFPGISLYLPRTM
ncbi:MAG: TRAP transporter large permease [Alphaproteobacteria bacterium]|nr:TRAP transporter large permease [Alphaproteobacteria bacterium]